MSSVYSTGYCGMGEWGRLQVEQYESVLVTLAALKIFIPTDAPLNIFFPGFFCGIQKEKQQNTSKFPKLHKKYDLKII